MHGWLAGKRGSSASGGTGRPHTAGTVPRLVVVLIFAGRIDQASVAVSAPPASIPIPDARSRVAMDSASKTWDLQRNPVAQPMVRARGIAAADRPVAGIPPCGFEQPVFWQAADGVVVDATVFTDLKAVQGRRAATLGVAGAEVGRIIVRGHDPLEVVKLLVHAGVIDANIHAAATVGVVATGRDDGGAWFRLESDARFWTNRENRERFAFGVRVSDEGDIRVVPPGSLPQ